MCDHYQGVECFKQKNSSKFLQKHGEKQGENVDEKLQLFFAIPRHIFYIKWKIHLFWFQKTVQTIKNKNLDDSLFSPSNLPENAVKVKARNINVHKFLENRFHGDVKLDSREVETGT